MKKILSVSILIILVVVVVMLVGKVNKGNIERAEVIRKNILGNTYIGERRDTKTIDKGGAIKLAAITDTKIVCEIKSNGTVIITTMKSYFDGMGIMIDGEMMYDDVKTSVEEYQLSEVEVAFFGSVKVKIGGSWYSVIADDKDNIGHIVVDGVLCEIC